MPDEREELPEGWDPRGPNKFEPETKAEPAPEEEPGRRPGQSREHH